MANMHPNLEPSMDTCTRIALIRSGLQKVFKRYNEPDAPIFDLRDEAVKLLRSVNLLKKRNFSAKHVGVHFKNRYGDGLIVAHVGKLALKFTIRGFSLEELGVPRATAMPPCRASSAHPVRGLQQGIGGQIEWHIARVRAERNRDLERAKDAHQSVSQVRAQGSPMR